MYDHLRQRGKELASSSRIEQSFPIHALLWKASEYARDMGKYEEFHDHIFHAYFTEALNIGDVEILSMVTARCGLDAVDMKNALKDHTFKPRLDDARKKGELITLTGVPTFIINEKYKIVGAQPVGVFSDLLEDHIGVGTVEKRCHVWQCLIHHHLVHLQSLDCGPLVKRNKWFYS